MLMTVWEGEDVKRTDGDGPLLVETASAHSPLFVTVNSIAPPLCQIETKRDWITIEHREVRCFSTFDY